MKTTEQRDYDRKFDKDVYDEAYYEGQGHKSGYTSYDNAKGIVRDQFHMVDMVMASRCEGRVTLDIGCAYGFGSAFMRERNWEPVGWDVSDYAISRAIQHYPDIPFEVKDIRDKEAWKDVPDKAIDLITGSELFEHVESEDVPLILREAARTSHWGLFVINGSTEPFKDGEDANGAMGDHGHLNHHDMTWWLKEISKYGVIDWEGMHQFGRMAYEKYPELRWHSRCIVVKFN